jgi:UPF0755 protein
LLKRILQLGLILFILLGSIAFYAYTIISSPNISPDKDQSIFYIPSGSSLQDVLDTLENRKLLENFPAFKRVAKLMQLSDSSLKPGRYKVDKEWSNRTLVNVIRSGRQDGVALVINNERTIEDLIGKISNQIEIDSSDLANYLLKDSTLTALGYNKENILSLFIPNTYEVWWNTSPAELVNRLRKEHDKWWNKNGRLDKISALNMTPAEAYTLASIVDKESNLNSEKPKVAGVYYNRLKRGIPLQADPTVVFATGEFNLRRVLNKHLEIDSPYNTYKYPGLPPGPIYMASIDGLKAVVNLENHDYLYFCAAPGYGSEHLFAKTLTQHNINARKFHRWLNKEGIK